MNSKIKNQLFDSDIDPKISEGLKLIKLKMQSRQNKTLSELGKTMSELKNGVYDINRLPED